MQTDACRERKTHTSAPSPTYHTPQPARRLTVSLSLTLPLCLGVCNGPLSGVQVADCDKDITITVYRQGQVFSLSLSLSLTHTLSLSPLSFSPPLSLCRQVCMWVHAGLRQVYMSAYRLWCWHVYLCVHPGLVLAARSASAYTHEACWSR